MLYKKLAANGNTPSLNKCPKDVATLTAKMKSQNECLQVDVRMAQLYKLN